MRTEQFISYHCIRDFSQIKVFNIFTWGQYIILSGTKIKLANTLEQNNQVRASAPKATYIVCAAPTINIHASNLKEMDVNLCAKKSHII